MQLDSMKPPKGSRKPRKRIGRGPGSGWGKTSGRGHKGAGARSGSKSTPGFEGGQMPMARRLPKRGFHNIHRVEYQVVNLTDLGAFGTGAVVDLQILAETGLAKRRMPVKILGNGTIGHALTVTAHAFSKSAKAAIEGAGGTCEQVALKPVKKDAE
jgi:large subunit ribosomal protein L15